MSKISEIEKFFLKIFIFALSTITWPKMKLIGPIMSILAFLVGNHLKLKHFQWLLGRKGIFEKLSRVKTQKMSVKAFTFVISIKLRESGRNFKRFEIFHRCPELPEYRLFAFFCIFSVFRAINVVLYLQNHLSKIFEIFFQ